MFTDDKLQPATACYLMMMLWPDYPALAALGTGEIPDAADKGAARSAIIVMTAVTITGCSWPQHLAEAMHTDDP